MWNLVGYFSCMLLEFSIWGCIHIYLGRLSERRRPSFWGAGERERAVPFLKSVWLCFPVLFKVISPALELLHSGWCEFPLFPSFPQHWGVLHCWTYRLFEIIQITFGNWSEVRVIVCNCWIESQSCLVPHLRPSTSFYPKDFPYGRWHWPLKKSKAQVLCQGAVLPFHASSWRAIPLSIFPGEEHTFDPSVSQDQQQSHPG